ncbi:aminoglycoside phosphotransferase family protein [Thalassotalea fusca]
MLDLRLDALLQWLNKQFDTDNIDIEALDGDAGFRRYFRIHVNGKCYIAVDAPPDTCNNPSFVDIAQRMRAVGVKTPAIHHVDKDKGWFCLEDFGNELLIQSLNEASLAPVYQDAFGPLLQFSRIDTQQLPYFDEAFIVRELDIFSEWLLDKHLGISLTALQDSAWQQCQSLLVTSALAQPQQFMHRDYHSRNIMRCADSSLGIIDFQDAVLGPITYDIVSLLKDCYVKWPRQQVLDLYSTYLEQLDSELVANYSKQQWIKWFDLMGMQRHLKASGIFARLHHRDNKSHYLKDIPLTLSYIVETADLYSEFAFLSELISTEVLPKIHQVGSK